MARKSKGFGELLNQNRSKKDQQKALEKLQRKVQKGPLKDQIAGIVTDPEGQEKMSEVLKAFIEPYKRTALNFDQEQKLVAIATLAWNLALLPESEQQSQIDLIVQDMFGDQKPQAKQDAKEILEELIARKRAVFADDKRYIIDYQLQNTRGGDNHLTVVSTLMDPAATS